MPCRKTFSENTAGKKMNSSGNSTGERIRIRVSSFRSNATSLSRIKRNADQRQNSIPHLSVVMHSSSPYRCGNSSTRIVCLEKITVCSLNTLHPLDLPALACIISCTRDMEDISPCGWTFCFQSSGSRLKPFIAKEWRKVRNGCCQTPVRPSEFSVHCHKGLWHHPDRPGPCISSHVRYPACKSGSWH